MIWAFSIPFTWESRSVRILAHSSPASNSGSRIERSSWVSGYMTCLLGRNRPLIATLYQYMSKCSCVLPKKEAHNPSLAVFNVQQSLLKQRANMVIIERVVNVPPLFAEANQV